MTEAELLPAVVELCEQRGVAWIHIHIDTPHCNKSDHLRGFRDLLASRRRRRPAYTGWRCWRQAAELKPILADRLAELAAMRKAEQP